MNATFPRLIVRYEDLLLHANEVIPQICQCVNGKLVNITEHGVTLSQASVKDIHQHGKTSNLREAMLRYGSQALRTKHFSKGDLIYADEYLRKELMDLFGYSDVGLQFEDEEEGERFIIQRPHQEQHTNIALN